MPIRILVVENQEIVRRGLEQVLGCSDMSLVGSCSTWSRAMGIISQRRIDVLLVDPVREMAQIFADLDQLRWVNPKVRAILHTALDHPAYAAKAFVIGAKGLVPKSISGEELLTAIRRVHRGEHLWTSEELIRCPASMLAKLQFDTGIPLTLREKEVLAQIAAGASNKQAAENLKISYETVKENVQQILKKIGVEDRTQAALWGTHKGLFADL